MRNLRWYSSVFIVCVALLVSFSGTAYAALYGVAAKNQASAPNLNYGTYGYNYVMSSPDVVNLHVSSIYVIDPAGAGENHVEVGWVIAPPAPRYLTSPHFFTARIQDTSYDETIFDEAEYDSSHCYKIWYNGVKWKLYIDGTLIESRVFTNDFCCGNTVCSSERNDIYNDTNYSHFWNLRWYSPDTGWHNWTKMREYMDNDPDYELIRNQNNRSCSMQIVEEG
ncbi:MAG: hypothetical protein ACM3MK_08880 [Chitinophagales bacterium]